ncbi:MAG: formate/nitrite transporter family protein [Clostridiales bacterium]|nr:formate/nitrite transporter family protein [Clostridiales bacterium]
MMGKADSSEAECEVQSMKTSFKRSAAAGIFICMGCIVNLKAGGGIPGAVLFSAGLWFVVNFDAELFTGRVTRPDYDPVQKLIMLVMNVLAAGACGYLASLFLPEIRETAAKITAGYADPVKVLWQSVMCGICMYLATTPPKGNVSRFPFVIYGVVLFILSGYGHSIALAGYAAIGQSVTWWVIPLAAAGNALGSYGIRWLIG